MRIAALVFVLVSYAHCAMAPAFAYQDMYAIVELRRDRPRLATAVRKIYELGLKPSLTKTERGKIEPIEFEFPLPNDRSQLLNFYAYRSVASNHVVMPVLSLKQLEDLTTAYAWLNAKRYSLSTIDMYFAMLRHKLVIDWPQGRFAEPLVALGVPKDAHKEAGVDATSLALRNEAYAFIILHELAHIFYRHKPYGRITRKQARADELQSDRFALDVMARTNTAPMGAVLFFQAQVYGMPHRGSFGSEKQWKTYLRTRATHPLSTERIRNMAMFIATDFAKRRPRERATWQIIGQRFGSVSKILDDVEIQRCIIKAASGSSIKVLRPTNRVVGIDACQ